jgi:mannose-6-phosphate isomerase
MADVFQDVEAMLAARGLKVVDSDLTRPWGGFYVLDEEQLDTFVAAYFPGLDLPSPRPKMSPKILVVASGKRLSWQYHHRRAELWQVIDGPVSVMLSSEDSEGQVTKLTTGQHLRIEQGIRHRLIGMNSYGVVAEIWQHTDSTSPSDEDDIIRVQDDFGR